MSRRPGAIPRMLTVALAVAGLTGTGAPAHADNGGLLVSHSISGPFTDQLADPLFTGFAPVVPRDRVEATFFVMNDSPWVARTTVALVRRGPGNDFTDSLRFALRVANAEVTGPLPPAGSGCMLAATGPDLAPGQVQPVDISFVVGDLVDQHGTRQQMVVDVDLSLSQVVPAGQVDACGEQASGAPPVDCDGAAVVALTGPAPCVPTVVEAGLHGGSGPLPDTGRVAGSVAVLALLGGGMALLLRRRRRTAPGPEDGATACAKD